ncbi:MAG TPA: branched-chain amino acid ABC transporter permease [Syntrophorhabdales bacterium]|nr:branched-chain amino acid ABC transporter permease [Syntrophorhabdales bacterium]
MSLSYIIESIISGLLLGGIYALLSVGFGLTWGTMKVLNISHAVFAVLGAFVAYWMFVKAGIDPLISLPLLATLLFLVGAVVYRLVIRPVQKAKDVIMASMVATFGVAIVVENAMSFFWRPDPRILKPPYAGSSIFIGDMAISQGPLIGFIMAVSAITLLYLFLHHTYIGKGVQATWQNPMGAALVGINPGRVSLITFALSIASAGLAGVAMAMIYAFYPSVQSVWTMFVFLVTIVGGVGSVIGTGLAGLLIGFIIGLCAAFLPFVWVNVLLFALLLAILLFKPEGLFGA